MDKQTHWVNVASHVPAIAARQPEVPAVVVQKSLGKKTVYEQHTFKELNEESDRLAHGLDRFGIRRGVRTVLMVKPGFQFVSLTVALAKIGAVAVFMDPGMGIRNLKRCIHKAQPEAFIAIPMAHAARALLGWGRSSLRLFVTVGRRGFWGGATLDGICDRAGMVYPVAETHADEIAAILFTSGSTGTAKGAVYTHSMFESQLEVLRRTFEIKPGERDVATFPLFALFGGGLGTTVILPDMDFGRPAKANPKKIIDAIQTLQATNMFGSPALIDVVGRYGAAHNVSLPSLKRVISGTAPATPESLRRFCSLLADGVEVLYCYGATESMPVSYIGTDELLGETARLTTQGGGVCVGRPIENINVSIIKITEERIDQWSDDLSSPGGEIGEIAVEGPVVSREYFNEPEATSMAKIAGRETGAIRHRMGDLGYLDDRGRLWMCGRKSHRVVTEDETLFTIPCERIFNTHPKVRRTALVGVKRNRAVEPVLYVELEQAGTRAEKDQIRRDLLQMAAANPKTKKIQTILFFPEFPVDVRHNAKILRENLAIRAGREFSSRRW